jgi:hypothetical protein
MPNPRLTLASLAAALLATTSAIAQNAPPSIAVQSIPVNVAAAAATDSPNYGTTLLTYEQVPAVAFTPYVSGSVYSLLAVNSGQALRTSANPGQYFGAPVHIPSGALVKYLELDACDDTGSTGYVQASIIQSDRLGNVTGAAPFILSDGTGCKFLSEDVTALGFVADNLTKRYWLAAFISAADGFKVGLASMVVGYQLQVSPAPAVASFVEALGASGITGGCGGGNFCPNNPVTRGQMAVFLSKALGLQFQ